jgi:GT2 family glycosyltransferase
MSSSLDSPAESVLDDSRQPKGRIFVIIPVHNRKHYTRACLRSLSQQTFRDFEIIVIDDGSKDGTDEMIESEFPKVVLLRGDGNLWWTRSINMGVEYALAQAVDYIVTLNDDIVLKDNFMEKMIRRAKEHPQSLLGGVEVDSITKTPTYGGKIIDWKLATNKSVLDGLTPDKWHGLHEVNHLPGRELLIPAEVFRKIGLFDAKNFPQTVADFDFTYRAYKAGYRIFCNYDATVETYPDSRGGLEFIQHKSLKNYCTHLFGIKGKANLYSFIRFALKNCPKQFLVTYVLIGVSRRIFGYLIAWIQEFIRPNTFFRPHA